jgi:hypothetical protein
MDSEITSGSPIVAGKELGKVWSNLPSDDLKPRPGWFDELGFSHISQMALDHIKGLQREWQDQQRLLPASERSRRWTVAPWKLVAEGIALGIRIGMEIERKRNANDT